MDFSVADVLFSLEREENKYFISPTFHAWYMYVCSIFFVIFQLLYSAVCKKKRSKLETKKISIMCL